MQYQQQYVQQPTGPTARQYNDTLTPVANFGFVFNHLFTVSLVNRNPRSNDYRENIKEKYIFFMSLIPGIGSRENRTYVFKQKITLKYSIREAFSLAFTLQVLSAGNESCLPYRKFSRQQTISKSCSIWTSVNQQSVKAINLTFDMNNVKNTISLMPNEAAGIAKIINEMAERGLDLEIQQQISSPKQTNSLNNNYQDQPTIHGGHGNIPDIGVIASQNYQQPIQNLNNQQLLPTTTQPNSNLDFQVAPPTNSQFPNNNFNQVPQQQNSNSFSSTTPNQMTNPSPNKIQSFGPASQSNTPQSAPTNQNQIFEQFGQMLQNVTDN